MFMFERNSPPPGCAAFPAMIVGALGFVGLTYAVRLACIRPADPAGDAKTQRVGARPEARIARNLNQPSDSRLEVSDVLAGRGKRLCTRLSVQVHIHRRLAWDSWNDFGECVLHHHNTLFDVFVSSF